MVADKNAVALFVKVVEIGSFSKAAVREGIPVSTVSRKIAELEKALGVRLLERSTRNLRLTDPGQDYFEACRRGLAEFEAAEALLTDRHTEISGRVRLSIPPSMSDIIILPLVRSFQQAYPGVVVHCQVTERFIDHIADGVDLSLRVGQPKDSNLIATNITVHRPRLVASPDYLATYLANNAKLTHPNDLIPHVKIAFSRWEKPLKWTLSNAKESAYIIPEPKLIINDYAGVLQGVIDGFGISETPGFICQAALDAGRLCEVLPDWQFASVQVCVTYPSRYLSPPVRVFRDFCVEYFATRSLS